MIKIDDLKFVDVEYGGPGVVSGTVVIKGNPDAPGYRRVRLFDRKSGRLLRQTWSDRVTGKYEFRGVAMGRAYTVVGYDHTGQHNATIADPAWPELMS